MKSLNDAFKELYSKNMLNLLPDGVKLYSLVVKGSRAVEQWLEIDIEEADIEKYPNAKKAAQLKNSKLYKALK